MNLYQLIHAGQTIAEKDCGQPIDFLMMDSDDTTISALIGNEIRNIQVKVKDPDLSDIRPYVDYVKRPKRVRLHAIDSDLRDPLMTYNIFSLGPLNLYWSTSSTIQTIMQPRLFGDIETSGIPAVYRWLENQGLTSEVEIDGDRYVRFFSQKKPDGILSRLTLEERYITPGRLAEMPIADLGDFNLNCYNIKGCDQPYNESVLTEIASIDGGSVPIFRDIPIRPDFKVV